MVRRFCRIWLLLLLAACGQGAENSEIPAGHQTSGAFPSDQQCAGARRDNISAPVIAKKRQILLQPGFWLLVQSTSDSGLFSDKPVFVVRPGESANIRMDEVEIRCIDPKLVGNQSDEQILDRLRGLYPQAGITFQFVENGGVIE